MTEPSNRDKDFAELMRAAQGGDGLCYTRLLEEITPRIRRIVRSQRAFLQLEDIEDLVQDVLLSVHAARATYDPNRPFIPWLLAITRNRLADAARRHARGTIYEIQTENMDVTFAKDLANTNMDSYGDVADLKAAIEALPPMQRDAIQMLKLGEMSLKEAASSTNSTVGALKVATHRAMMALRKILMKDK
jgi:RNA polymerase sigma-70 factor (ECF subfamily)